jgi:hypothetical protein
MSDYKNILVSKDYNGTFYSEVPVYVFDPLEISGKANLYLIGNDLYADITSETDIGNYYLDFHRINKNLDILLLMNYDKRQVGLGRIKDQVVNSVINK